MRLTLRTLLAYLDDQLEPAEIKRIGQKVAESDAAQELIARIKQVTRRRRLTTPPDGGAGERFDANIVAEYLDNELSSEQVAELEKLCLESDVHLAEISASHQILTLVLGEPALVPPPAKRRMYDLVKGRKPKPARKPVAASTNGQPGVDPDADETLLLGLPLFRKAPWLRWALPLAAVLLLAVLGGILWKTLSGPGGTHVASNGTPKDDSPRDSDKKQDNDKKTDKTGQPAKDPSKQNPNDKKGTDPDKSKPKDPDKDKPKNPDKGTVDLPKPIDKPNDDPKEAGRFVSKAKDEALVHQTKDGEWEIIPDKGAVFTGESLVGLPSYKSELRLKGGVNLLLWGALPELGVKTPILESAVTLHQTRDLDADLTLQRGRIYLTNRKEKGPAQVRLRFWHEEEVWDITLEGPDAMIGAELFSGYPPNVKFSTGEEPTAVVILYVVKGGAKIKIGYDIYSMHAAPGLDLIYWNSKGKKRHKLEEGPVFHPNAIPEWNPDQSLTRQHQKLRAVRDELLGQLTKKGKTVETGLVESLQSRELEHRVLALRCLGAIDAVPSLVDGLGDPMNPEVRIEAAAALRNWIGRGKEQAAKLYDPKKRSGILTKKLGAREAETVLYLLDGIPEQDLKRLETYEALLDYLKYNRIEVRELAYAHLLTIFGEDKEKPSYNPAGTTEEFNQGADEWQKFFQNKLKSKPKPPGKQ